jgi:nicotinate phosphoribosyltransferase
VLQVRRFRSEKEFIGDAIYDQSRPAPASFTIVDPLDPTRRKHIAGSAPGEDLLVPIFQAGRRVYRAPSLEQTRERVRQQLACLHPGIKRLRQPASICRRPRAGIARSENPPGSERPGRNWSHARA